MHGVLSGPSDLSGLEDFITKARPGIKITNVDAFNDVVSLTHDETPCCIDTRDNHEGINLICVAIIHFDDFNITTQVYGL